MRDFTLDELKSWCDWSLDAGPVNDWFLDARFEEQVSIIGHTNPYYRLMWRIARELRPALSVELGSWQATAAAHLAAGNPDGFVITVDIHREDLSAMGRAREAADRYPNLEYLRCWTWDDMAVNEARSRGPVDVLFIDAWHEYQYAIREWNLYGPLLADTALVIADDIFDAAGATVDMVKFWEEISAGCESFLDARPHPGIQMGFLKIERRETPLATFNAGGSTTLNWTDG